MPSNNKLLYGDNLELLRKYCKDETVDLCYIDPPFNSKRDYFQIYNGLGEDVAQAKAFIDTWKWDATAQKGFEEILSNANNRFTEKTINLIKGLHVVFGDKDLMAYLIHITLRAVEIHRVLKKTGSFYLHCDPTASHYLKIILDTIFVDNGGEFLNEIVWCYKSGGAGSTRFAKKHDVILFYAKDRRNYKFNQTKEISYNRDFKPYRFKGVQEYQDENGKWYTLVNCKDYWDIPMVGRTSKERLGYPTQKPEALLERIIQASSNPGDVVLDAYCGCGTTVAVAQKLGRRWIGMDVTFQSISLILSRMEHKFPDQWQKIKDNLQLIGLPQDMASVNSLINSGDDKLHKELEKWAVLTYANNKARINDAYGADGGIDGISYFMNGIVNGKKTFGKIIYQVKSNNGNRMSVSQFRTDVQDAGGEIGIFILNGKPTALMKESARKAGYYRNPAYGNIEIPRIQFVSFEDIVVHGKRLEIPGVISELNLAEKHHDFEQTAFDM